MVQTVFLKLMESFKFYAQYRPFIHGPVTKHFALASINYMFIVIKYMVQPNNQPIRFLWIMGLENNQ